MEWECFDYYDVLESITKAAMQEASASVAKDPEFHMCSNDCSTTCEQRDVLMEAMFLRMRKFLSEAIRRSALPLPVQQFAMKRIKLHVDAGYHKETKEKFVYPHACIDMGDFTIFGPVGAGDGVHQTLSLNAVLERSLLQRPSSLVTHERTLYHCCSEDGDNDIFLVAPDEVGARIWFSKVYRSYGSEGPGAPNAHLVAIKMVLKKIKTLDPVVDWTIISRTSPTDPVPANHPLREEVVRCYQFILDEGLTQLGLVPLVTIEQAAQQKGGAALFSYMGTTYQYSMPGALAFLESTRVAATTPELQAAHRRSVFYNTAPLIQKEPGSITWSWSPAKTTYQN